MSRRTRRKAKARNRSRTPKSQCLIYVVADADDNIKYCGQTRCNLADKVEWLEKAARKNPHTPFNSWLLRQIADGAEWKMRVVDYAGTWDVSEVIWIERLRAAGHKLLNVSRGGRDVVNYPVNYIARPTKLAKKMPSCHVLDESMRNEHLASILFES